MVTDTFALLADEECVEFWSQQRLPFEPKGPMVAARETLRDALRELTPAPGLSLNATYSSLDSRFCDVENILFYNVGAAAFDRVAGTAIHFGRERSAPAMAPHGRTFPHHQRYQIGPRPTHRSDSPICTMVFPVPGLSTSLKPHQVWWEATRAIVTRSATLASPFELRVELDSPRPVRNLTAIVKPLLDGLISGLHSDRNRHPTAVERLRSKTGWDANEIVARLKSPIANLLGERDLLHVYREFVKWNPADELCEGCTVEQRTGTAPVARITIWPRR